MSETPTLNSSAEVSPLLCVLEWSAEGLAEVDSSDDSFVTCNSTNSACASLLDTKQIGANTINDAPEVIFYPHITAWAGDDAPEIDCSDDVLTCPELVGSRPFPCSGNSNLLVDIQPNSSNDVEQATQSTVPDVKPSFAGESALGLTHNTSRVLHTNFGRAGSFVDTPTGNLGAKDLCLTFGNLGGCILKDFAGGSPRKTPVNSGTSSRPLSPLSATTNAANLTGGQAKEVPLYTKGLCTPLGDRGSSVHGDYRIESPSTQDQVSNPSIVTPWLKLENSSPPASVETFNESTSPFENITRASTSQSTNGFPELPSFTSPVTRRMALTRFPRASTGFGHIASASARLSVSPIKCEGIERPMAQRNNVRQLPVPRSSAWPSEFLIATGYNGTLDEQASNLSIASGVDVLSRTKRKEFCTENESMAITEITQDTLRNPLKKSKADIFAKRFPGVGVGVGEGEGLGFGLTMRTKETNHHRYTEAFKQHFAGPTGIDRPGGQILNPSATSTTYNSALLVVTSALPPPFAPPSLPTRTASSP
ncbi:hypothetical protein BDV93DRAFT_548538, partial [Ceratobasidium sp. AG-I]